MRPVDEKFRISQGFGSLATEGVTGNLRGSQVQVLVAMYGNYQPDGHAGADIACPVGTPVRAARSGTVIYCNWDVNLPGGPNDWAARWFFYQRFGGRLLLIQHAPNDIDVYAHLSAWKVKRGQFVNAGELIALSGDSSAGKDGQLGPHLHTERIVNTAYPTRGGLIYGRTDPTTVWGGISAQGTTTTKDGFDMAEVEEVIEGIFNKKIKIGDGSGEITLAQMLAWYDPNRAKDLEAIFNRPINRAGGQKGVTSLDSTLAYQDANLTKILTQNAALQVQIEKLVGALAATAGAKGEPFDQAKLLASISAAVKGALPTTVTFK